jgi:hypothetical protein
MTDKDPLVEKVREKVIKRYESLKKTLDNIQELRRGKAQFKAAVALGQLDDLIGEFDEALLRMKELCEQKARKDERKKWIKEHNNRELYHAQQELDRDKQIAQLQAEIKVTQRQVTKLWKQNKKLREKVLDEAINQFIKTERVMYSGNVVIDELKKLYNKDKEEA